MVTESHSKALFHTLKVILSQNCLNSPFPFGQVIVMQIFRTAMVLFLLLLHSSRI